MWDLLNRNLSIFPALYYFIKIFFQKQLSGDPVGTFSGHLGNTRKTTYTNYQTIIFPNAIYNSGSYDTTTGIFTAPVTAVYYIHLDIQSCGPGYPEMVVRVKQGPTHKFVGHVGMGWDKPGTSHESGSGTMLVKIQKGEQIIWDTYSHSGTACLFSDFNVGYTFLAIYPIDSAYSKLQM